MTYTNIPLLDKDFDRTDALRDLSARVAIAQAKQETRFVFRLNKGENQ